MVYPKNFDPTIHEYNPIQIDISTPGRMGESIDGLCVDCRRPPHHHFHTGVFGSGCGCIDCMPWVKSMTETAPLNQRKRWFGRIFNR